MTHPDRPEAQLYDHTHKLLRAHEVLLDDRVRNRVFYKALKKCIRSDSTVLDIGAGTGIWAIAAARLGAKKVVAVEMDELLIGLIRILAEENGVGEKVEAVLGNSLEIQLEREFDIVISETIGYLGYDESIVPIMMDARKRFLKNGGLLIPETVSLYAAAGHLKTEKEIVPNGLPFDFKRLAKLNLHSPRVLQNRRGVKLLTEPRCLIETDLYKATEQPPALENLHAEWNLVNADPINCFIVWSESGLTEGVPLSTRRTNSWLPNLFRIEPVDGDFNQVAFELSLTAASNYWTVTFSNGQTEKIQQYSPEFAATELKLYSQTDDLSLVERLLASLKHQLPL